MALTAEVIKANADLANLTDAQLAAITTLSANEEKQVINTKIGELHGRYDEDVKYNRHRKSSGENVRLC